MFRLPRTPALIVALFGASASLAQDCDAPDVRDRLSSAELAQFEAEVDKIPFAKGIIWTATRGDDTLTIAGSLHVPDPRLAPIRAALQAPLANADLLMLEATDQDQAAMQEEIARNTDIVLLPDNQTLIELLPADVWEQVSEMARKRGVPPFTIARLQPWLIGMIMGLPTCMMTELQAGGLGLDAMINQDANAIGLPVAPLEDWRDMLAMMSGAPLDEQLEFLTLSAFGQGIENEIFTSLLDLYFEGNVGAIWPLNAYVLPYIDGLDVERAQVVMDQQTELLLDVRNEQWIPVIETATETADDIVIVFGAAHLPGENGVLKLLENQGWLITPFN